MTVIGNTVRLTAEFKTFAGVLSDAENVSLLIKDSDGSTLINVTYPTGIVRVSVGQYRYDFTVPAGIGYINYEWSGFLENSVILNRKYLTREFGRETNE